MRQKVQIVIQARMGSTRLPGKVLKPIMQKPLLGYLIERLRRVMHPHSLLLATTTNFQDDILETFAKKQKIPVFRGSEEDVLDRYYQACCKFPAEIIVRITSDCPLMDPAIVDKAIDLLQKKAVDYVSNAQHRTYPRGMDVEVFTFRALKKAMEQATSPSDREHVTPYIYHHPDEFSLANLTYPKDLSDYRLTVDTPEDFLLISKIFENLYSINKNFTLEDIMKAFEKHPEWKEINAHVKQKGGV